MSMVSADDCIPDCLALRGIKRVRHWGRYRQGLLLITRIARFHWLEDWANRWLLFFCKWFCPQIWNRRHLRDPSRYQNATSFPNNNAVWATKHTLILSWHADCLGESVLSYFVIICFAECPFRCSDLFIYIYSFIHFLEYAVIAPQVSQLPQNCLHSCRNKILV